VRCRDANNRLSAPTEVTVSNPAPAAIVPTITPALGANRISYLLPVDADFSGVLIWRSTTSGFTPAQANLIHDGSDSVYIDNAIAVGTTYFYRLAAYDAFGKPLDGVGLNLSSQFSAAPIGITGNDITGTINGAVIDNNTIPASKMATTARVVEVVNTLPTTGNFEGRLAFLTTDDKVYRHTGGAWTSAVDGNDITANSIVAGKFAAGAVTSDALASFAVTARHLLVTDWENLITNSRGATTDG
jgi:hypothetical protein